MSDSLRPHESQHARPPCPSPTPGVNSDSRPSSPWCHPAISYSVVPFSSCPQSLPASGSFPMSQLFAWGGQRIGVSASTSVLPMNTQDRSPLGWTGWFSLQSKDSQESSPTPQYKSISSSVLSFLHSPTLISIHDHWKNPYGRKWRGTKKPLDESRDITLTSSTIWQTGSFLSKKSFPWNPHTFLPHMHFPASSNLVSSLHSLFSLTQ